MRKIFEKSSKIITWVMMVLAVLLTAWLTISSSNDMAKDMVKAFEKIGMTLNIFFIATYIILGLSIFLALFFAVTSIFVKPKAAKNGLIGIGALVLILVVSFLLSTSAIDPEFTSKMASTITVTDGMSKQVGAGLIAAYILGALSILAVIGSAVYKFVKG
ncbi:MAG TPA: hypothetical protein P5228_03785 [Bacteroidales bacterium]|nr:hypothetical protein [Bacteroidales bacterium]